MYVGAFSTPQLQVDNPDSTTPRAESKRNTFASSAARTRLDPARRTVEVLAATPTATSRRLQESLTPERRVLQFDYLVAREFCVPNALHTVKDHQKRTTH